MFYAEEPHNSIGSNFNATPRNNPDMRSDVCLLFTVFVTIKGEKIICRFIEFVTDL